MCCLELILHSLSRIVAVLLFDLLTQGRLHVLVVLRLHGVGGVGGRIGSALSGEVLQGGTGRTALTGRSVVN